MLTVKQIEAAKPKEKPYRLLDGNGLYLYVPVSGKKVWQLRYKIDGKEKILTVGKYPLMTLQEARDKAWTARKDISVGIDPVKAKKASSNNNSFSAIYKEWYEHKKQVWSVGYATELAKMFDDDILPIIGGLEIQDIEPMQLLEVIRRFEDRGAMERANKARRRCGEVFRYAIVTGRAKYNPAPDLADAMKGYRKKNFPFLPADQIPAFNKALATIIGMSFVFKSDSVWSFLEPLLLVYQNYNGMAPQFGTHVMGTPWTLAYELLFYAIFVLAISITHKHRAALSIAILILMPISLQLIFNDSFSIQSSAFANASKDIPMYGVIRMASGTIMFEFAIGILLGVSFKKMKKIDITQSASTLFFYSGVMISIAILITNGNQISKFGLQGYFIPSIVLFISFFLVMLPTY